MGEGITYATSSLIVLISGHIFYVSAGTHHTHNRGIKCKCKSITTKRGSLSDNLVNRWIERNTFECDAHNILFHVDTLRINYKGSCLTEWSLMTYDWLPFLIRNWIRCIKKTTAVPYTYHLKALSKMDGPYITVGAIWYCCLLKIGKENKIFLSVRKSTSRSEHMHIWCLWIPNFKLFASSPKSLCQ